MLHHIIEPLVAHDDRVQDCIGIVGKLVLLQNRHPQTGLDGDLSLGCLQLSGEQPQKGRFSGAVGADDAVAVAGEKLEIDVLEQERPAELEGHIADCDHSFHLWFSLSYIFPEIKCK